MDHRLHIAHVVISLQPGGLENGVVNVINRLSSTRFRSSVCAMRLAGEFAARITAPDVLTHELGWKGGNDLRLLLRMAKHFREVRPDIVHTRNVEAFYYGVIAAKLAGVPCVVHSEHGRTFDDSRARFWVQRALSRLSDATFCVSSQLKADLVRHVGIPGTQIRVLPNGVDTRSFSGAAREQAREALGVGAEEILIGSVGRLVPVKNYGLLLEAVSALPLDRLRLVLVGDGPERGALESLARARGLASRTLFTGHRNEVAELLAALDLFVLPSLSEGMSNTLLEAMASGVPVVASDVGGNTEIIQNGVSGLLFPCGDAQILSAQLGEMLDQPARRLQFAAAAQARVRSDFSLEAMASRYEALYDSLAVKRPER